MCGINGFLALNKVENLSEQLTAMNNFIIHRGPDANGEFVAIEYQYSIAMGMRRLSIIDLNTGNQPIYSEDLSKVIVFNGEIYNYQILKNQLINQGCVFKTNSDTEVILKLYEKEGVRSFGKLDGMFAFSIYDKTIGKVYIARDFFGEKPLYYSQTKDGFIWASELKSIIRTLNNKPEIDTTALTMYFQLTYIPAPHTIYEGIHKLEANHYIEIDCVENSYKVLELVESTSKFMIQSKKEAIKVTNELVQKSVASRSISDVPLGTFLSGGVDSSIVSLCLAQQQEQKIDTFSIGFDKKSFDESDKSRLVSKLINSNHHEFIISEKDLTANIDEIILNFDEPFADSSALATYLVSKKTKDYVKVALTGDGGDEVFGGYNKYYMGKLNQKYTSLIPKRLHENGLSFVNKLLASREDSRGLKFKANRLLQSINYEGDFYYNIISLGFNESELKDILQPNVYMPAVLNYYKNSTLAKSNTIGNFRAIDKKLSLEGDMLVKVDRTSMLASLECRAPFLNKELWDFTNQLPDSYLINGWDKKHILKEAFKEYFPNDFLNKSKKGFGVPVGDWLRSDLRSELLSYIDEAFINKQNIFQFDIVSKIVEDHLNLKKDNTFRVWTYYCFQKWYKNTYEA
ncbi:asparagine synthase (glutamine-hydrolyzing) [Flavobacterium ammonificans]|uniref:asparagine synthase (glutamine-hydrolyzing) n=1 Tax=Flavobacterium ammonificans TaxID=1751056 RepID=UPI001E3E940F|nr:asparagine synthase (glutamine-hydrolyzing) [Flavobacterium ammonificans]BDB56769.1 asparagine synthetase B [Flavobacterium ammonificans]